MAIVPLFTSYAQQVRRQMPARAGLSSRVPGHRLRIEPQPAVISLATCCTAEYRSVLLADRGGKTGAFNRAHAART
jgi:hypothetical protein